MVSTPWSEKSPLEAIQFPRWGSSRLENGLNNLGWETWCYELRPLRGHTHSFHNSGRGWRIIPSACEKRSLLTGISHGEPSRRETRSENHTRPSQNGATSNSRTPSRRTLSRTPGGKAYRQSFGHVCTIASSPSGAGLVRVPEGTVRYLMSHKQIHLCLAKNSPNLPPFPGPQPLPRQDVCSYIEMPRNIDCSQREKLVLGPHKEGARAQTSLVVDIRNHSCVVGAY